MLGRRPWPLALAIGVGSFMAAGPAWAGPGVANRLAGGSAQGPASSSVTAIYHNPAMLGTMPGLSFETTTRVGVDHLTVRRFGIDTSGEPTDALGGRVQLVNPMFDYFIGASFLLDPVAIGAAVHTFDPRLRINSDPSLAYHLASDDDLGCSVDSSRFCPQLRQGGMMEMRTDFDLALAWNALHFMSIGATAHFPRQRIYLAHDVDSVLTGANSDTGCDPQSASVENPACAERLSFRGNTRLRWFGLNPKPATRLDFAVTIGIAFTIRKRGTLGIRYRTQPLLAGGSTTVNGSAAVCSPNGAANAQSSLPTCEGAAPIEATITERLPRELAIGGAVEFGNWKLDSNLFWIDRCPGRSDKSGGCGGRDARDLELVGLDQDASTLPQTTVYRGLRDVYGVELWARHRLDDSDWREPALLQGLVQRRPRGRRRSGQAPALRAPHRPPARGWVQLTRCSPERVDGRPERRLDGARNLGDQLQPAHAQRDVVADPVLRARPAGPDPRRTRRFRPGVPSERGDRVRAQRR